MTESFDELVLCQLASPTTCSQLRTGTVARDAYGGIDCVGDHPPWVRAYLSDRESDDEAAIYQAAIEAEATRGIRASLERGALPEDAPIPFDRWIPFEEVLRSGHRVPSYP